MSYEPHRPLYQRISDSTSKAYSRRQNHESINEQMENITMVYSVSLVLSIEADNEQEAIERFCSVIAVGNFDTDQVEVEEERADDVLFTENEINSIPE